MIFIPAADPTFVMPVVGSKDQTPKAQRFHVDAFCIDRTEVPASKWSDSLCGAPQLGCLYDASRSGPAVCIEHRQAECYCERATPGVRKRLPTDPEFLLAALGTDGRIHPWGNEAVPSGAKVGRNFCPQQDGPSKDWVCYVENNTRDVSPYGVIGLGTNGNEMTGTCLGTIGEQVCVLRGDYGVGPLLAHGVSDRSGAAGATATLSFRCAVSERVR
jgi:formylglycine-generating enzyme required for sulfatase activity